MLFAARNEHTNKPLYKMLGSGNASKGLALILYCHSTGAVLILYCNSTGAVLILYCHSTGAVLILYCHSTGVVLILYCHSLLVLYWPYKYNVLVSMSGYPLLSQAAPPSWWATMVPAPSAASISF